ncbi:glycosyltransferase [Phycicoccus flavus]|uniref:Glycosyltransferase n=1 Tax=Phycicoccus flavus TaxID=2502783 RepID=A0A8T6RAF7_9MICO|nr:glycosyltransferase [Phycicoccus flavus]NHA69161.1 glycosyltransferase [Phycicoccus flavus]
MSVSVVVVGFGDEPVLRACLQSVVAQLGPDDEAVLVDHGVTTLPDVAGVRVVTPASNTGFGGGCAAGVEATSGDVLVFVNSDAELRPGALAALAAIVADPGVGLAGGLVLLPGDDDVVNSVGLPVHLTGLSWCDGYGERLADRHRSPRPLASVAGALFACRREVWDRLGGMDAGYFMYHEDTDLSLRCHLAGLDVVYCPDAVAVHAYEFSRNARKMFHLERNRFLTVLADYPPHLLARVLPVLAVLEPLYLVIAVRDGWWREKVRAWGWLLRHGGRVRARRRRVQAGVVDPHALDRLLSPAVTQTQLEQPGAIALLNVVLRLYWWLARPRPARGGRPDVVVLRTNPKDSSLPRLLTILTARHRTLALVWDRTADYRCPVASPRLRVDANRRRGEYYRLSTVITVASLQPWLLWRALRARPRVVHAMDLDTGVVGLLAARLLRVPFVYQCLDPYDAHLPAGWPPVVARLVHRVENAVVTAADLFVVTDLGRMPQHDGSQPRRVVELANVPMRPADPRPVGEDDGLVVGYVGSLVPHRALDVLVDVVGSLADDGVRLVLGGFGPLEAELRRQAACHSNVSFLGWVPDDEIMSVMAAFDVFAVVEDPDHLAYRWTSPNKVFESMALGRPVLVAEGTLGAERGVEAGHGVTVRYGDPADLRATLLDLRDDPARRAALGRAGHAAFTARWSPDRLTEQVLAAYPLPAPARAEMRR